MRVRDRDCVDGLEALRIRIVEIDAYIHAAGELLIRVPLGRANRRDINRLDHFVRQATATVGAVLDETDALIAKVLKPKRGR